MNSFTISDLQQYSGIKAHTIRIWEQRYHALKPHRSEGNTRYYDGLQLRRLLNIVSLLGSEYKVSELCKMSDDELFQLIESHLKQLPKREPLVENWVTQLIAAGMNFDEVHFSRIFSIAIHQLGMQNTYLKVIYPMLVRIGMMWSSGSMPTSCEHFISNLLKQKLFSALDSLPTIKPSGNNWLLFLPENEFHEIGLLFSHFLIRQAGNSVVNLGGNVPLAALINASKEINPTHLLLFMVHFDEVEHAQNYLSDLRNHFKKTKIFISGNVKLISNLKLDSKMFWLRSTEELEQQL